MVRIVSHQSTELSSKTITEIYETQLKYTLQKLTVIFVAEEQKTLIDPRIEMGEITLVSGFSIKTLRNTLDMLDRDPYRVEHKIHIREHISSAVKVI